MTIDNGGPAYPSGSVRKTKPAHDPGADWITTAVEEPLHEGLSVRDLFAAMIVQGFAADPNIIGSNESIAAAAYRWADAMITERNKK